jgi:NTP pyrophosphatase (non-canonical NTP hydrolase)
MEIDDYQSGAEATAIYPGQNTDDGITYCTLGLVGEAGELANKWKKYFRDDIPLEQIIDTMRAELGDVLWYIANLAAELGVSLGEIAEGNLAKLARRAEQGTLTGSGDTR